MSRDDETAAAAPEAQAVAAEETQQEQNVTGTDSATQEQAESQETEAGENAGSEAQAEKPAEPAGPTDEEIKAALAAFETLAAAAVETRDKNTGEIPADEVTKVREAYAALPTTPAKTRARNGLAEAMKAALVKERAADKARAYLTLGEEVKSASKATKETVAKAPVDITAEHVARVTSLYLSTSFVDAPEGVDASWADQVKNKAAALMGEIGTYKAYQAELAKWQATDEANRQGDEPKAPDVDPIVVSAFRIARGRPTSPGRKPGSGKAAGAPKASTAGYSGPRRSVKAHIQSAFASVPVGTFLKIAEIANHTSAEYGSDHPSSGAVSAALFPPSGKAASIEGLQPTEEGGVKGARKIA